MTKNLLKSFATPLIAASHIQGATITLQEGVNGYTGCEDVSMNNEHIVITKITGYFQSSANAESPSPVLGYFHC